MIQFYAPDIDTSPILPPDEGMHCVKVLRKSIGDTINITNGKGSRFLCEIIAANPKRGEVEVKIIEKTSTPNHWNPKITIAIAPTKNIDRMEWLVEKSVEIGVDKIVFLKCEHSERKTIKLDRLEKIAVSAVKQSLKTIVPSLRADVPFMKFIDEINAPNICKYIAHCEKDKPRINFASQLFGEKIHQITDIIMLIGPEGDFSETEIKHALSANFKAVSLGESRLRTETAALFGLATIHTVLQIHNNNYAN